jgi:hypothetical protein
MITSSELKKMWKRAVAIAASMVMSNLLLCGRRNVFIALLRSGVEERLHVL